MVAVLVSPFLLLATAYAVGTRQPAERHLRREIVVAASPARVQILLESPDLQPSWWRRIVRIEPLEGLEPGGGVTDPVPVPSAPVRQIFRSGRSAHLRVEQAAPGAGQPMAVSWRLRDPAGPYRGVWRFEISPAPGGSRVVLREDARLGNPFARLLVALGGGGGALADDCLRDLAAWAARGAARTPNDAPQAHRIGARAAQPCATTFA